MSRFFCAELSRQMGEDIVGSAPAYQSYVFIECPLPWTAKAFESKSVPENLKALVSQVQQDKLPIRFLLMATSRNNFNHAPRILLFQKIEGISAGYRRQELEVANINDIAPTISKYLTAHGLEITEQKNNTRDFFVCIHGSHDKCCARYGYPLFRKALSLVREFDLKDVRFWQVSHIGGHRFAPTMISFPDGRYYGALDEASLQALLLRRGDITCMNRVYRGSGMVPRKMQVLERELMLRHGWDWLNYKINYRILPEQTKQEQTTVRLICEKPSQQILVYQADIAVDTAKTLTLKGSCSSENETQFVKYTAKNIQLISQHQAWENTICA